MNTVQNFFDSWRTAATDKNFYRACRLVRLWPHQVENARTSEDLERLHEEWLEDVLKLVTDKLDSCEEHEHGAVRKPEDIPLPEDGFPRYDPEIRVTQWSFDTGINPRSDYRFLRTKVEGRQKALNVSTARCYSTKPSVIQPDIPLEDLDLGQLRDIRLVLRYERP